MALPRNHDQLSERLQQQLGLPPGYKVFSPFPFGSMNQQASRQGMPDNEFYVRENFIKVGDGNLRTLWDKGAAIYTAPNGKSIVNFFFFNI